MEAALIRERLEAARVGRLGTVTPDGRPHLVPCCFALDRDTIFSAVDAKPKTTLALRRLTNVRARPDVALLVDEYTEDWARLWWVRIDGRATVVDATAEREHALAVLAAKYAQYRRDPPPGPVLAIAITAWRAWP